MMDLYSGYDQCVLHEELHNLTTFGTPLGLHQLTMLLQGHANAVQVYQGKTAFILQDEIPNYTSPFIDNVPVKLVKMRYQRADGSYKTIVQNPGICCFIWEHCIVINHILQQLENVSVTVSATKFVLAIPTAIIVRHKCTFEGHILEDSKVQKICNWPECHTVTQVCSFLGTCGILCIFIHNFSKITCPEDGKHYPSHFRSISLTEVKNCYSQAKLELYGLFHALHTVCMHIFGITNLTVEVDTKNIKGMINNPDLQPNATIN
jgi:hypothetical protein